METSICKLGYWTSMIGVVRAVIYLAAVAGMFISGTVPLPQNIHG